MGEFIVVLFLIISFVCFGAFRQYAGEAGARKQIIADKGFCISAETNGVEFKKCYELKEKI